LAQVYDLYVFDALASSEHRHAILLRFIAFRAL